MSATAPVAVSRPTPPRAKSPGLAGAAFWTLMRRIAVLALCVDVLYFVLFHVLGPPVLAWINVVSVAMYGAAYVLILQRRNAAAIFLMWAEVLGHATLGTVLLGWESGFHYFLLMFIPLIGMGRSARAMIALLALLLACYLGLDALSHHRGAVSPLSPAGLMTVRWINIVIVFSMFVSLAYFYRGTILRAEKRLHLMATRDPLTGLANRQHFQSLAEHEVTRSRRSGEPVALVMADVDFFKRINDRHGHDAGDTVLGHIGDTLLRTVREQDIVARWGGEEFLMLLPNTDAAGARVVAERIRRSVGSFEVAHEGQGIASTLSFGTTTLRPEESLSDALRRVDSALYRSKAEGRNRVVSE
ncbi:MAG: diguanylate cyclase [Methylibium sp.]|uniref:GGDEF domain-containing protein n=1 Tax=Methylibium sp. TaxID=2067992 RepID=UPI0017946A10|nr:diguanylate cyclase [Methylibium sp.]MBA3598766.1 diguanylate cyclase [Methylibium sp.]